MEDTIIVNGEKIPLGEFKEILATVRSIAGEDIQIEMMQQPTEGVGPQLEDNQEKANVPVANSEGIVPEQSINLATAGSCLSTPNMTFGIERYLREEREILIQCQGAARRTWENFISVTKSLLISVIAIIIWKVYEAGKEYLTSPVTEIDLNFNTTICKE